MDFLDILLEAKGNAPASPPKSNTIKVKSPISKKNDYTAADDEEIPDDTDEKDTDPESGTDEDDEGTDYTEDEKDVDPSEDEVPEDEEDYTDDGGDEGTDEDDEGTDYTGDDDPDGTDGSDDADSSDGTDPDGTDGDNTGDQTDETTDNDKNSILIDDFVSLYYLTKNSINKLSNIDKTDIFINRIVTQVISNFTELQKQLFDFITFRFSKNKYINNLYQFNYFLEAFKINVEMLKKISVLVTNS